MPVGSFEVLPDIICEVDKKRPLSVLDIGIGNGLNGASIRNYFPDISIKGIEGFENYRNCMWGCYNEVQVIDFRDYVPHETFDCIIMTDVLEHFEKEEGFKILDKIKSMLAPNGIALISTPAVWIEQGAYGGNELETHRSLWALEDFEEWKIIKDGNPGKYGHCMFLIKFTA